MTQRWGAEKVLETRVLLVETWVFIEFEENAPSQLLTVDF